MKGSLDATVDEALDELRQGRPVLVVDDVDRENEGDVVLAAQTLTDEWMAWTIRHTSGFLCAPLQEDLADRLGLPLMVTNNADPLRTAYTVTVDARLGVTTGISAADRAHTVRTMARPDATADDLIRPGHVLPLRAKRGGVLARPGHTEAAVDLCRLAGLVPVAAIGELVRDDGAMMRVPDVLRIAQDHQLVVITIDRLIRWRELNERVIRASETTLATPEGRFTLVDFRDLVTGDHHLALISPGGLSGTAPLVRLHRECPAGDTFGSLQCDCGTRLQHALRRTAEHGGVVVYLRGREGHDGGLCSASHAHARRGRVPDPKDAATDPPPAIIAEEYRAGAAILRELGVTTARLLTDNRREVAALEEGEISVVGVEPVTLPAVASTLDNPRSQHDPMHHRLLIEAKRD